MPGTMNTTDLSAPNARAAEKARRVALDALLKTWGAPAALQTGLSAALGAIQYALFAGFAWGAASAVNALVTGAAIRPGLSLALLCAVLRALAQAGETRCGAEASALARRSVRREAAQALTRKSPAETERSESGQTGAALIDAVEKLDGFYGRYRPLTIVVLAGPFIIMTAAFMASYVIGLFFLITAPLLIVFMALAGAGAAAASSDQLSTLQRLAGRFNDRLQALETLNAFNAARREQAGLATASEDFRKRTMKVLTLAFLSSGIMEFFAALSVAASAIYIGFSLLGEMPFETGESPTLRTGLFVLILAPEFYMPLRRLSAAYHDRADAIAAAQALEPFFESGKDTGGTRSARRIIHAPALRFETVGSVYADGRRGLESLSFEAGAGQITALWGASGAGKSTALKVLMGYAPLSEGRIWIDGEELEGGLAGQAAWIAQRPRMFHGTLKENITLFDDSLSDAIVQTAASAAGVMDFAASLPDGLDTEIGEQGYGVSGGQVQRVALARALAADVKVLLLDEPTAHLDGETEARFLTALKSAARGRTVLIATHSPAVRALADRVIDVVIADKGCA